MARQNFNWELPQAIEDRLGVYTYGNQRTIFEENHLLIILHDLPKFQKKETEPQIFLVKPDLSFWYNGYENGKFGMNALLESYKKIYDELDEKASEAKTAKDFFVILEKLLPLTRKVKLLAKTLQTAREQVPNFSDMIAFRDWGAELQQGFDVLLADCKLSLDFRVAQQTEQQVIDTNASIKAQNKLNLMASFTFPIMAVSTIFGMNLANGLENMTPIYFWGVCAIGVGVGFWTKSWLFSKNKS